MNTRIPSKRGFTLIEIMIVVATIGLLASVAIPNYVKSRSVSQKSACINNLRQLDSAVQQWALENKKAVSASVTFPDLTPYLKSTPVCPAGGTTVADSYAVSDVATPPECISRGGTAVNGHYYPQ